MFCAKKRGHSLVGWLCALNLWAMVMLQATHMVLRNGIMLQALETPYRAADNDQRSDAP